MLTNNIVFQKPSPDTVCRSCDSVWFNAAGAGRANPRSSSCPRRWNAGSKRRSRATISALRCRRPHTEVPQLHQLRRDGPPRPRVAARPRRNTALLCHGGPSGAAGCIHGRKRLPDLRHDARRYSPWHRSTRPRTRPARPGGQDRYIERPPRRLVQRLQWRSSSQPRGSASIRIARSARGKKAAAPHCRSGKISWEPP